MRRRLALRLALAGALVASAGRLPAQGLGTPPVVDTVPRVVGVLRPGDVLKVIVRRDEDLTGNWIIDSQGFVQIPGLGAIRMAGLSPEQAKERLLEEMIRLGRGDPGIAVWPAIRLSVLGEVRNPGVFEVEPGTSVLQLLTLAGGLTDRADPSEAHVLRELHRYPVDLRSALAGSITGRLPLYSNDVLVVPRETGLTRENLGFILSGAGLVLSIVNVLLSMR